MNKFKLKTYKERFKQLVEIEPRLEILRKRAQSINRSVAARKDKPFCALTPWDGSGCGGRMDCSLKEQVHNLLNRAEGSAQLKGWQAEEITAQVIYNCLPDCRGFCMDEEHLEYPDPSEEPGHWPQKGAF